MDELDVREIRLAGGMLEGGGGVCFGAVGFHGAKGLKFAGKS